MNKGEENEILIQKELNEKKYCFKLNAATWIYYKN